MYASSKIYHAISPGGRYKIEGTTATFTKDRARWRIVGAHAPIVNPTTRPKRWPVYGDGFEVLVIPEPITNERILPYTYQIRNAVKSDRIAIQACPGEYEPASFVIRTGDVALKNANITVSDLFRISETPKSDGKSMISSQSIDVRLVKCWYQAGESIRDLDNKTLTPELLLHNEMLVDANHLWQVNIVRDFREIDDSENLHPFDVEERSNKQVWLTFSIPEDIGPGQYKGTITISSQSAKSQVLMTAVNVLPFHLSAAKCYYSIYYLGELRPDKAHKSFVFKTHRGMLREFLDLKSHGIDNPILQQRILNLSELEEVLDLKDKSGLDNSTLFLTSWPKLITDPEGLDKFGQNLETLAKFVKQRGIPEFYYYAVDELKDRKLYQERPMLELIRNAGVKSMTACEASFINKIDDLLDLAIFQGPPPDHIVDRVHSLGNTIWIYANPQCGEEKPETYRRNYGLLLWKLGIDGSSPYAYQCPMGARAWDDFDHSRYRDQLMTYPTADAFIPTIQWEGYREGVDDMRYLSTLMAAINDCDDPEAVADNEAWLRTLNLNQSLYSIRQEMAKRIESLQKR
jgi:hypothetical protein